MVMTDQNDDKDFCDTLVTLMKGVLFYIIEMGKSAIREEGTLNYIAFSALKRVKGGQAKDSYDLAAFLMYSIITKQPFRDANKRTGFLLAISLISSIENAVSFYEKLYKSSNRTSRDEEIITFLLDIEKNKGHDEENITNAATFLRKLLPKT